MAKQKKENQENNDISQMSNIELAREFVKSIENRFDKGSAFTCDSILDVPRSKSGSYLLDNILGGGYPYGRIIEVLGHESSGKTTLATIAASILQKNNPDKLIGFVDAENASDIGYMKKLGLDEKSLVTSQINLAEEALEITHEMVKSNKFCGIIVDSVAALVPKEEYVGDMGDKNMALVARIMSQAMRKMVADISKSGCIVFFINQYRDSFNMYGSKDKPTGGNALKFYASQRIDVRKGQVIKNKEDEIIGNIIHFRIMKNKVAAPFGACETELIYGKGFNHQKEIIDLAISKDIIKKAGSWFSYEETKIGQGMDKVIEMMDDNPELFEEIKTKTI